MEAYKNLSPYLTDALIATEDVRYTRHSGVDIKVLAVLQYALYSWVRAQVAEVQLHSNLRSTLSERHCQKFFNYEEDQTWCFKFKEWQTAIKLERSYTKEEIITMYLNKFDFSYNAIG